MKSVGIGHWSEGHCEKEAFAVIFSGTPEAEFWQTCLPQYPTSGASSECPSVYNSPMLLLACHATNIRPLGQTTLWIQIAACGCLEAFLYHWTAQVQSLLQSSRLH